MSYRYEFPRPAVTADVAFFTVPTDHLQVLLIQRKGPPFRGRWATPGGFLDLDEELEQAARRELAEETGLEVARLHPFGLFGKVSRDPRGRTISAAFLALHPGPPPQAAAGDDASDARWFRADALPRLAFDHRHLLAEAVTALRQQTELAGLAFELLPARFTLRRLRTVYGAVFGRPLDAGGFRRLVLRAGVVQEATRPRGAKGNEKWYRRARTRRWPRLGLYP